EASLARTPWTEAVIWEERLQIRHLTRANRIHFAAVREDVLESRENALEGLNPKHVPLAHALLALLERSHPEAFLPKPPMSIALLCLPRSIAAVAVARGESLLLTQFDLTQLILSEMTALREGGRSPFGYRGHVPETTAEMEALVYQHVVEMALDHVR